MAKTAETSQLPRRLPAPSGHGSYWLGKPTTCPAIFKSGKQDEKGRDRWFASLGNLEEGFGVLTDGDSLRYFYTPEEALKALRDYSAPLFLRGGK